MQNFKTRVAKICKTTFTGVSNMQNYKIQKLQLVICHTDKTSADDIKW